MTARVLLLFFWAGKDDAGSGYIRRGASSADSREEFFQVLFGSDPQKAPRAINCWGAATEIARHKDPLTTPPREFNVVSSTFFGFMKSSRGKSVAEMQSALKNEQERGQHSFTGILSRVEPARAFPSSLRCNPIPISRSTSTSLPPLSCLIIFKPRTAQCGP